ncbi:MAG: lysylphosphatidylglycerol synthase transmembrane domain-containing protein [Bacteroidales bacterium]
MVSNRVVSLLKYLLLLGLAIFLLWLSFRGVSWHEVVEGLKKTKFEWVLLSMAVGTASFLFRALRWRLIMVPLNKGVTRSDAWHGVTVGYLTNFAIPRAGELARCGVVAKRRKIPFDKLFGTVILERSIDLLSLLLVTVTVITLRFEKFGNFIQKEIIGGIEERFSLNFWLLFSIVILLLFLVLFLLFRYRKRSAIFNKIVAFLKGIYSGLIAGFKMERRGLFLLYTALIWFSYWLMSYTTILAFSSVATLDPAVATLDWADALFLSVVGGLGWLVPVQGGIGAYHFIITLALSSIYAIDTGLGALFATISHESQAITMILFGALSLFFINRKNVKSSL